MNGLPSGPAGWGGVLDGLRGVRWPARRTVRGVMHGAHASRMVGTSPEFSEYRPYRQGEDPRRLDWKLLARTDRAYLRVTSDRSMLGTLVVVDASASMAFPEETHGKWAQACAVSMGLLAVAAASGDPVGLVVVAGAEVRRLPVRARRGAIAEAARLLGDTSPGGDAPLEPALPAGPSASRVVVVSDLLGGEGETRAWATRQVLAGGEAYAVHVVAEEELDPPTGLAVDPERRELRRSLGDATRAAYLESYSAWRAEVARAWRAAGAAFVEVRTSEPPVRAVRRIAGQAAERSAR
jgi:uncharacterized protein (DUF58 family)